MAHKMFPAMAKLQKLQFQSLELNLPQLFLINKKNNNKNYFKVILFIVLVFTTDVKECEYTHKHHKLRKANIIEGLSIYEQTDG